MKIHVPQRPGQKIIATEQQGRMTRVPGAGRRRVHDVITVAAAVLLIGGAVSVRDAAISSPAVTTVVASGNYPEFTAAATYLHVSPLVPGSATPASIPAVIDGSTATTISADRGSAVEATATTVNHSLPVNLRANRPWRR